MTTTTTDEAEIIRQYVQALQVNTAEAAQTRAWCAEQLRGHHGPLDLRLDPGRVRFIREHIEKLPDESREQLEKQQDQAEAEQQAALEELQAAQFRYQQAQGAVKTARDALSEADKEMRVLHEFITKYPFAGLAVRRELEAAGIDTSPLERIDPDADNATS